MRWYERLYVGEKAKKHRYETIQAVRNGQAYQKQDLLIVGIAEDFEDASMLAGRIVSETYKKTNGYDVNSFLFGKGCCE